ncbi:MAG: AraC family transcriptional regulator [Rhizobacter sp.]
MDVLANVLAITRLGNSVLNQSELLPPWGLEVDAFSIAAVHVVQRGSCWLRLDRKSAPTRLEVGDLVLVARGMRHSLSDAPRTKVQPYEAALSAMAQRLGRGETSPDSALILCAAFEFVHEGPHPLLGVLPEVIHLRRHDVTADRTLSLLLDLLLLEATGRASGTELVVPRLIDVLLVFIVRSWIALQPRGTTGWVGALRDPLVGRALEQIHLKPAHPWRIEELAQAVATSRPTLVRRFSEMVGISPAAYLTQWRMTLAAQLLRDTHHALDAVAEQSGYGSPAAFSKAFRKHFQRAPGAYREAMRSA